MTSCLLSCTRPIPKRGSSLNGKNLLPRRLHCLKMGYSEGYEFALLGRKIFLFRVDLFSEGGKLILKELPPLKV